jgi:hypothetical protein
MFGRYAWDIFLVNRIWYPSWPGFVDCGLFMTTYPGGFEPRQYAQEILCPKCSNRGVILWEGTREEKTLVRMSTAFYERLSKKPPHPIELVCQKCGNPLTD